MKTVFFSFLLKLEILWSVCRKSVGSFAVSSGLLSHNSMVMSLLSISMRSYWVKKVMVCSLFSGVSVRNIQAFQVLQSVFIKVCSSPAKWVCLWSLLTKLGFFICIDWVMHLRIYIYSSLAWIIGLSWWCGCLCLCLGFIHVCWGVRLGHVIWSFVFNTQLLLYGHIGGKRIIKIGGGGGGASGILWWGLIPAYLLYDVCGRLPVHTHPHLFTLLCLFSPFTVRDKSAVQYHTGCAEQYIPPGHCQLLHSRISKYTLTVCWEDFPQTPRHSSECTATGRVCIYYCCCDCVTLY